MVSTILSLFILCSHPVQMEQGDSLREHTHTIAADPDSIPYSSFASDFTLLTNHIPHNPYPEKKKPGFLLVGKKKWIRYNPISLVFGGMLFLYQSVISSQIAADCPYEVSCSNFSKQSIQQFGLIKGLPLSADRITRCSKPALKDLHPLRINQDGRIIDFPSYYSSKPGH